ncbi:response regulator transcription factor [Chloroflexota bacterium]
MKILIAEDDPVSRRMLQATLIKWDYEVVVTSDGHEAWQTLQQKDAPRLAILDWMMPGMDGIDICRKIRATSESEPFHLILLTIKGETEDIVAGLQAGADDYVTKPFQPEELQARVQVGVRVVQLQLELADRVKALEEALAQVKQLQGMLPICSYCKNVRIDQNYWEQIDIYIAEHSEADFTHGICPDCRKKIIEPELEELRRQREKS